MAKRYEIEAPEWERINHLFTKAKTGRPPKWDDKTMFNAILWLARRRCQLEEYSQPLSAASKRLQQILQMS